jgi:hypothetical protein
MIPVGVWVQRVCAIWQIVDLCDRRVQIAQRLGDDCSWADRAGSTGVAYVVCRERAGWRHVRKEGVEARSARYQVTITISSIEVVVTLTPRVGVVWDLYVGGGKADRVVGLEQRRMACPTLMTFFAVT